MHCRYCGWEFLEKTVDDLTPSHKNNNEVECPGSRRTAVPMWPRTNGDPLYFSPDDTQYVKRITRRKHGC